jgi:aminoglycoside phosphotransferase (APT) family kinase protein
MNLAADVSSWIVRQVRHGRRLVQAQRLTGGLTSEVTGVTVEDVSGRRHRLVLRRWTGTPWPDGTVDDGRVLVPREAATLASLEATAIPAPRVVATDADGEDAGLPALLMTRLPGRLDLTPVDPKAWLERLVAQLVDIHDLPPPAGLPAFESWLSVRDTEVPEWTTRPQLWRAALDSVATEPAVAADGFSHRDYQQYNVLWSAGRLSGVVDWVWASQGPPDVDVAHCRLNLCLLYGADRAIAFQTAYESLSGRRLDPWWDLAGVVDGLGWSAAELQKQAGRRLRVDGAAFPARLDALLERVVRRG